MVLLSLCKQLVMQICEAHGHRVCDGVEYQYHVATVSACAAPGRRHEMPLVCLALANPMVKRLAVQLEAEVVASYWHLVDKFDPATHPHVAT